MTCTFDRELLALYAGNDVEPDEREVVEVHLGTCRECADILAQYRAGAEALAGSAAVAVPSGLGPAAGLRMRGRRRPDWVTAAAAAVVVLLAVTLFQGPVLAAVLRWFQVKELSPAETQAFVESKPEVDYVPQLADSVVPSQAATLEERYGLPIAHPETGDGWEWLSVTVPRGTPPARISYHYVLKSGGGTFYLHQERAPFERTHLVAEGMSQQVTVRGQPAWIIRGAFVKVSDANPTGYSEGNHSELIMEWQGGQELRLFLHHSTWTREQREAELLRIAESLK